jgi:hypothetical protein
MTYLIKRDDALAAIQEYAVQEVGASRTPNLKGAADAICDVPAINPATIREDILREVLALCKDYPYVEGVENAILELIGEKK